MGERMSGLKYDVALNPMGILYNPMSIAQSLRQLMAGKAFKEDDLFEHQELWHSPFHHGSFSHPVKMRALEQMNAQLDQGRRHLQSCRHLMITFGTSWIYRHLDTDIVVANCHKVPQSAFEKSLLSVSAIKSLYHEVVNELLEFNSDMEITFTVSPIRHLKDGFTENGASKARLRAAIDELLDKVTKCNYFPSYEIMMDDLRDYRFYEADLLHPNAQALDYIWSIFRRTRIPKHDRELQDEVEQINKSIAHRPFHPELNAHRKFLEHLLTKIEAVQKKAPFLDFDPEREQVLKSLSECS